MICALQGGKARKAHGSDDDSDEDFGAAKKAPKKKAAPKKAEVRCCVMRFEVQGADMPASDVSVASRSCCSGKIAACGNAADAHPIRSKYQLQGQHQTMLHQLCSRTCWQPTPTSTPS